MILFVGLGNPGPKYAHNRHNVGFMAIDAIVRRHGLSTGRGRFSGITHEGTIAGEKVLALMPETYMNESGRAVGEAVRFYKLIPEDIIVLHDEVDLAPGKVKVKAGGGMAGHNGLKSIGDHIGKNFRRVRIGVGKPANKNLVDRHVLSDFSKDEEQWLEPLIDAIADAAPELALGKDAQFMNLVVAALRPDEEADTGSDNSTHKKDD